MSWECIITTLYRIVRNRGPLGIIGRYLTWRVGAVVLWGVALEVVFQVNKLRAGGKLKPCLKKAIVGYDGVPKHVS